MTSAFEDLPALLPGAEVLLHDIEPYGSDHLAFRGMPGAVVRPHSTEQVAQLLALSAERGFAVMPRAAATNLSGSILPRPDAVVVDMTAMDRVVSIDAESLRAVVEPGLLNGAFQERLAPLGVCWSPDPASRPISTIGGNILTNAGGPGCIKYGVTFHHVHAVEVVLADGRVVLLRDTDPVDLLGVMIGSEGTLGLVTRAELRLRSLPPAAWTALASFRDIANAAETVSAVIAERINVAAVEMLDRRGVEVIDAWRASGYPTSPEALLFVEIDGEPEEIEAEAPRLLDTLIRADPAVRVARTPEERAALWAGRLGIGLAMTSLGKRNFVNDVTVPRQRIPELVARVRSIAARHEIDVPIVAHAGDGNVHPVILYDPHERVAVFTAAFEMTDAALDLGGTITGEHGVGSDKIAHMSRRFTPAEIASFRAVKRAFDPDGRMNPGVLYPERSNTEPVDRQLEDLVTVALAGSVPRRTTDRTSARADDSIRVDEENLTVRAGAAARCEDVRAALAARSLDCTAVDGTGSIGDVLTVPESRGAVRPVLLELEAEMKHGPVRFGSDAVKDVAGLDAKRLLACSWGAVGEILSAAFRASPRRG